MDLRIEPKQIGLRVKADNMKSVKDSDTKKKINVCAKCYDEIKH